MRLLWVVLLVSCASANSDAPVRPVRELVVGGARVRGGGIRMDVQLGRRALAQPTRTTTTVATPDSVVRP